MRSRKAAMFGLEGESLKKQPGELFLARLQRLTFRLVEGHQAIRLLHSKAAMFGLDARIALAIFASLSVIVGASLATVIKNVKATQYINEIRELEKSIEAFYLDTGTYPDYDTDYASEVHIHEIIENDRSIVGWKGSYAALEINLSHDVRSKIDSANGGYFVVRLGDFVSVDHQARRPCSVIDINELGCVMWIEWYRVNKEIIDLINKKVDNDDDLLNGKVRYCSSCGDGVGSIFFRVDII